MRVALVGEVIVRTRNMAGDPCQVQPAPIMHSLTSGGAGQFNGTIFVVLTFVNSYGETNSSPESSIGGLSNNAISISGTALPVGVTNGRAYFGDASGNQSYYVSYSGPGPWVVGRNTDTFVPGIPPYKSSCYLPDSDGDLVSTFEMYRWLNAGLVELGRLAGGILDQTGVAMPAGNDTVQIPGWWLSIKYTWHNGWVVLAEQQSYTWLQSPVTGIPGIVTLWQNGAKQVLGTWPQPSTAPTVTTLTNPMGATDTLAQVVDANGFTAPGMCQIDNEIMSYSASDVVDTPNQLTGIVRPFSGTIAAAHLAGATVTQLILRLLGRRMPTMLSPGQGNNLLDMPQGWDAILDDYIMARFKRTEQDEDAAQKLIQSFMSRSKELRDDTIPLESKQIGGLYPLGDAAATLASVMDTVVVQ